MIKFNLVSAAITVILCTACTANPTSQNRSVVADATPTTNVSWDNLVSVVKTGDYQSVGQQHDNTVRLILNDGRVLQAKQPKIDAIYEVVQNCPKCVGKPFMTE